MDRMYHNTHLHPPSKYRTQLPGGCVSGVGGGKTGCWNTLPLPACSRHRCKDNFETYQYRSNFNLTAYFSLVPRITPTLHPVKERDTGKVTSRDTDKVTSRDTGKVTAGDTGKVTSGDTGKVTARDTGKVTSGDTDKVTARDTGKVTSGDTGKVTSGDTGKVTSGDTVKVTSRDTDKVTSRDTGKVTSRATDKVTFRYTDKVTSRDTDKVTSRDPDKCERWCGQVASPGRRRRNSSGAYQPAARRTGCRPQHERHRGPEQKDYTSFRKVVLDPWNIPVSISSPIGDIPWYVHNDPRAPLMHGMPASNINGCVISEVNRGHSVLRTRVIYLAFKTDTMTLLRMSQLVRNGGPRDMGGIRMGILAPTRRLLELHREDSGHNMSTDGNVLTMNGDSAAAVERLEALFRGARLEDLKKPREHFILETKVDTRTCGLHGRHSLQHNGIDNRRGSLGNILHQQQQRRRDGVGPRRESMPALHVPSRRRDSLALPPPRRPDVLTHPSAFPSTLRRDSTGTSMGSLNKGSLSKSTTHLRRDSTPGLLKREFHTASHASLRRESVSSIPFLRKSSQVSLGSSRKDSLNSLIGAGPRDAWRRVSTDSLDSARRNSLDVGRRDSTGWEDPIWEEISKKMGKGNYNQHTNGTAELFSWGNEYQHTHGIAGLFAWSNGSNKKPTYGRLRGCLHVATTQQQETQGILGWFVCSNDKESTNGIADLFYGSTLTNEDFDKNVLTEDEKPLNYNNFYRELKRSPASSPASPTPRCISGTAGAREPIFGLSVPLEASEKRKYSPTLSAFPPSDTFMEKFPHSFPTPILPNYCVFGAWAHHQFAISARLPPDTLHFIDVLVSDENHIPSWESVCQVIKPTNKSSQDQQHSHCGGLRVPSQGPLEPY
uniref:Uncharacterized protein n=1 Tax=Timema poppense TaxID=170557 RepID=A0A7R9CHR7_TIMPO|nr:unnamed protein product [Timema poppensis]